MTIERIGRSFRCSYQGSTAVFFITDRVQAIVTDYLWAKGLNGAHY